MNAVASVLAPAELKELSEVLLDVRHLFRGIRRKGWVNSAGADASCSGSRRLLLHHTAHYLMAARVAEQMGAPSGPVIDVGGGVGALGIWLARRLGVPLWLVDSDAAVRSVARRAFPEIRLFADVSDVPPAGGAVVVAMDVIEHVEPRHQQAFAQALVEMMAPGALLAISTPDESRYPGSWSGYGPHIGTLNAAGLEDLLRNIGLDGVVWRMEGGPFDLGRMQRIAHPVANRLWSSLIKHASHATFAAAAAGSSVAPLFFGLGTAGGRFRETSVQIVPPDHGKGVGLFAAGLLT